MTIPAILNDLLDYEDMERRQEQTYIWVKKGKKEEAWAACALLGMVIEKSIELGGHFADNTYIFVPLKKATSSFSSMVGVEARFHLRDLQIYFEKWETDNGM